MTIVDRELRARVHQRFVAGTPVADHAVRAELAELLRTEAPLLTEGDFEQLLCSLLDEVHGLGPLEPLLADPYVTEVMVNGPGRVYVERAGSVEPVTVDLEAHEITRLVERVIAPLGLRLDRSAPIVDARLGDGSRLHAVIPPLAVEGPYVTIRRFATRSIDLAGFGCTGGAAAFLRWAVAAGWNLLVAGGTSSGKTTLVQSLAAAIPRGERVVTIEETAELRLGHAHVVRLEARPANAEGVGQVSVRDLVRAALRMRPDRVIVGEVRGAEALDLLQALNTGHDGSFSTVHANRASDALRRLETLALFSGELPLAAVRGQLAAAVDGIVQVARAADGRRCVTEVAEVGDDGVDVRTLFSRRDAELVGLASPTRAPRRHGTSAPDRRWFRC